MDTVICNLRELAEKEVKKAVEKIIAQNTGTIVNCGLEECKHNMDGICTADEISLDDEHCCNGGCDYGWKMEDEDEEDVHINLEWWGKTTSERAEEAVYHINELLQPGVLRNDHQDALKMAADALKVMYGIKSQKK